MPATPKAAHLNTRKGKQDRQDVYVDDEDRVDYANPAYPLELSSQDSPFRDADADIVSAETPDAEVPEPLSGLRSEVPIEELISPPKRKDEKISSGYEMVASPQSRVYTIESDPSMSIISDESWEHISNNGSSVGEELQLVPDDRKLYAEVVKEPAPEERA